VYLLVFHAYVTEMQVQEAKSSVKKSRQAALRGWI
jgi:hypothetical protein